MFSNFSRRSKRARSTRQTNPMTPAATRTGASLVVFSFTANTYTKKPEQHKAALVWRLSGCQPDARLGFAATRGDRGNITYGLIGYHLHRRRRSGAVKLQVHLEQVPQFDCGNRGDQTGADVVFLFA